MGGKGDCTLLGRQIALTDVPDAAALSRRGSTFGNRWRGTSYAIKVVRYAGPMDARLSYMSLLLESYGVREASLRYNGGND